MDMLKLIRERYTTKHYDATRRVSDEDMAASTPSRGTSL